MSVAKAPSSGTGSKHWQSLLPGLLLLLLLLVFTPTGAALLRESTTTTATRLEALLWRGAAVGTFTLELAFAVSLLMLVAALCTGAATTAVTATGTLASLRLLTRSATAIGAV